MFELNQNISQKRSVKISSLESFFIPISLLFVLYDERNEIFILTLAPKAKKPWKRIYYTKVEIERLLALYKHIFRSARGHISERERMRVYVHECARPHIKKREDACIDDYI